MNPGVYLETKYMIDTTPAATLKDEWCDTEFFKQSCFFPDEIVYELKDNTGISQRVISEQRIPVSLGVLYQLQNSIMHKIGRIVDLYSYNGNGDALLIATVLDEQHKELGMMVKTRWIIATEDKGLSSKAREYGIECIGKSELYKILQEACDEEGTK